MLVRIAGIRKYEPDLIRLRGEANDIIAYGVPKTNLILFHFVYEGAESESADTHENL